MSYEEREHRVIRQLDEIESFMINATELMQTQLEKIEQLEQENEDLKGQLKQWGIDKEQGGKRGLFLK